MSIVVHAPPPRCARCGEIASARPDQTVCAACGADLPAREAPIVVPISGDIALGETLPAIHKVEVPAICGTAMLSIERITQLRLTTDAASIEATRIGDTVRLRLVPHVTVDGLALPASVGVSIGESEEHVDRAGAVFVNLVPEQAVSFDFPFDRGVPSAVVTLTFADAICRRRVDVG